MKNIKYILIISFFAFETSFGFSISLTNAPKISKIGGIITFSGIVYPENNTKIHIGKTYAGNISTLVGGQFSTKLPNGFSTKNSVFLTDITLGQTDFYQNITNTTYTGGTVGSLTPTTFETQTKPLEFAPTAMVLVDYYNSSYLKAYFSHDKITLSSKMMVFENSIFQKNYQISNLGVQQSFIDVGKNVQKLKVSELNSNGSLDIVPYSIFANQSIYYIDNNVGLTNASIFANDYTFSDFDNDNKLDLFYLSSGSLFWKKNVSTNSNFSFTGFNSASLSGFSPPGLNLNAIDLDNDNRQEIVVSVGKDFNNSPNNLQIYTTTSTNLISIATITTPSAVTKVEHTDLNDDGFHDLVLKYGFQDSIAIIENKYRNGSFTDFSAPSLIRIGQGALISDLTTGDIDGDAIPEIIVSYTQNSISKIRVYKSNFVLNPTNHQNINASSYITAQDYNTDAFFNTNPVLGLEVADMNADGKMDIVAYGSEQSQTTTAGMFMVLLNKSCAAPEIGVLGKEILFGQIIIPRFACSGATLDIIATASGDNLTATWEGFTENRTTIPATMENINLQNNPAINISTKNTNVQNYQLGFKPTQSDTISRIFKISVNGSCGESTVDEVTVGEVLKSPTLAQTTTICGEPLLKIENINTTKPIYGDIFYNGNVIFKDQGIEENQPELFANYKPFVAGSYAMQLEIFGITSQFNSYSKNCKTNEVLVKQIENSIDITATNNINFTNFSAPKNPGVYRWYLNDRLIVNQTTSGFSTNYKGNYRVEFQDVSGCKSISKSILIDNPAFFDLPNGRGEITLSLHKSEKLFQIYPNPVHDVLHINLDDISQKTSLKLIDNLGSTKIETFLQNHTNQIDVSGLHSGIYVIHISVNGSVFSHKIIVF